MFIYTIRYLELILYYYSRGASAGPTRKAGTCRAICNVDQWWSELDPGSHVKISAFILPLSNKAVLRDLRVQIDLFRGCQRSRRGRPGITWAIWNGGLRWSELDPKFHVKISALILPLRNGDFWAICTCKSAILGGVPAEPTWTLRHYMGHLERGPMVKWAGSKVPC